jgi:hypothetical protein
LTVTLPGRPRNADIADAELTFIKALQSLLHQHFRPKQLCKPKFNLVSYSLKISLAFQCLSKLQWSIFFLEEYNRLTSRSQCSDLHRKNYHSFHVDNDKNSGAYHIYVYCNRNSTSQHHNFVQQLRSSGVDSPRSHDDHLELCHHNYQRRCSVDSHIIRSLHRSR